MSRFIFFLLILANNSVIGQTINGLAVSTQAAHYTTTVRELIDSNPAKPSTITGSYTVKVIIPSKTVCRQKVSTFFILTVPDTLIGQPIKELTAIAIPAREASTGTTSFTIPGIQAGAGSDVMELLLKTPGRIVDNPVLNYLVDTGVLAACLSSIWVTPHLSR